MFSNIQLLLSFHLLFYLQSKTADNWFVVYVTNESGYKILIKSWASDNNCRLLDFLNLLSCDWLLLKKFLFHRPTVIL